MSSRLVHNDLIHIGSDVQQPVRNMEKVRNKQKDQKESDFRIICVELKSRLWEKTKIPETENVEKEKKCNLKKNLGLYTFVEGKKQRNY